MTGETWTVKRILEWIEGYLAQHGDEQPRISSQWLVSEALGTSRMQLFLDADRPLSNDERARLREWTRRRADGEPLQYITGKAAFRHIAVKVRPGVLIPRPETEVLVSEALSLLPEPERPQDALDRNIIGQLVELGEVDAAAVPTDPGSGQLLVADICTGTGCIACSIAHEHAGTRVVATDISPEAVILARENVELLGLEERIEVIECDLGDGIDGEAFGQLDLVVSNPPYVPTSVLASIPHEVASYEPELALDGGSDGLGVYRRLLAWCEVSLKPGGSFAFELHETCLEQAALEASRAGFERIRVAEDLAGRPRVLTGEHPR